jgi:ATP-dependent Clp protease adaptor protein ClpS
MTIQNSTATETVVKTKPTDVKIPRFAVIFHNDDYTPMDFVVELLVSLFHHSVEKAKSLTLQIHEDNKAIVGEYYYELAEQKCAEAITLARANGHPLQVEVQKI